MTDDRALLNSLIAEPADAARWLVYADWLDDHGDPRGEYLRLVHALSTHPDTECRRRLNAVRPILPREWLALVEQPALLNANPTPYPALWSGFGLGDLRPIDATYAGSAYGSLPPVPAAWLTGFEDWFARVADSVPPRHDPVEDDEEEFEDEDAAEMRALQDEELESGVQRLSDAAAEWGLRLPDSFARVFLDERYPRLFRSVTDCYFNLPERIVPAPESGGAGLVRFYSDSQGCLHWYLYLTPEGDECVVASGAHVGGSWVLRRLAEQSNWRYEDEDDARGEFWFCAPSFAEFVVRAWLENMAWYAVHPGYGGDREAAASRTAEVRAYLNHYRGQRSEGSGEKATGVDF
jgi:uncharacterized protein (TIGR02996 family)